MRLKLDIECPVDRNVPQPEFLSVLRALNRMVMGRVEMVGDDYSNGIEIIDYDEARIIGKVSLQAG